MAHKKTDSFVFRRTYYEFLKTLSDSNFYFCFMAICNYALDCIPIPEHEDPFINEKLKEICEQIDKDLYSYQKRCRNGR